MVQRIKKQNTYIDHVKNMVKVHKTTIKNVSEPTKPVEETMVQTIEQTTRRKR